MSERVEIRAYGDGDLEAVRGLLNEVVARGDAFVYEEAFSAEEARGWVGMYPIAYVAEVGGRVVGWYGVRANWPGRGGHVANAAYMVSASSRGGGVGRKLGEHSLAAAREAGFTGMQFNAVVETNEGAVRLWESLGFEVIGKVPGGFRRGDGALVRLLIMYRAL